MVDKIIMVMLNYHEIEIRIYSKQCDVTHVLLQLFPLFLYNIDKIFTVNILVFSAMLIKF